jgi:hypothetical protein
MPVLIPPRDGLTRTLAYAERTVELESFWPGCTNNTANAAVVGYITDEANAIVANGQVYASGVGNTGSSMLIKRSALQLAAGTHDFKVRGQTSAGTGACIANADYPAYLLARLA